MKIALILKLRQSQELFPSQLHWIVYVTMDFQAPFGQRDRRPDAKVEDREVMDLALAGRETIR
jgi:hypothetical protein